MVEPPYAPWILKEDGTLDANFVAHRIVFQSSLNVLLLFGPQNEVCVVDTNSGNTLQTVRLPGEHWGVRGGGRIGVNMVDDDVNRLRRLGVHDERLITRCTWGVGVCVRKSVCE